MRIKFYIILLTWAANLAIHMASLAWPTYSTGVLPDFLRTIYIVTGLLNFYFFPGFFLLLALKKNEEISFVDFLSSVFLSILILILNVNLARILKIGQVYRGLPGITSLVILLISFYCRLKHKKYFVLSGFLKTSLKRFATVFVVLSVLTVVFALPLIKQANFVFDCREEAILSLPTGAQTDLHEKVGMMRGLKDRIFPYWDLEHERRFGPLIYELVPTYIYFINSAIFGDSFSAFYIYFFCCLLLAALIAWELAQSSSERMPDYGSGAVILAAICGYFWLTLKFPNHIAISTHLWVLLLLAQVLALSWRAWLLFYLACAMAFFTKEISLVFSWASAIIFAKFFLGKEEAAGLYKRLGFVTGMLLLFFIGFGILTNNLVVMGKIFAWDYLARYDYFGMLQGFFREGYTPLKPETGFWNNIDFVAWVIGASFFQAVFFFFPSKDKLTRMLTYLGLVYIFFVLLSQFKLMHYAFFLVLLAAPVCYRKIRHFSLVWVLVMALIFPLFIFTLRNCYDEYFFSRYSHMNKILFNNSFDFQRELEKNRQ